MRRLAPALLLTAKAQEWKPERFLHTLVEAEVAARVASNLRNRMRQGIFPVIEPQPATPEPIEFAGKFVQLARRGSATGHAPRDDQLLASCGLGRSAG